MVHLGSLKTTYDPHSLKDHMVPYVTLCAPGSVRCRNFGDPMCPHVPQGAP